MGMISSSKSVIGSSKSVIDDNPSVLGNSSVIAGSGVSPDFVFDVDTENAGTLSDEFQLPLVSAGTLDFTISHPDLINSPITITAFNDAATLLTFNTDGIKTGITCVMNNGTTLSGWKFDAGGDRLKLLDVSNCGQFDISNDDAFFGCSNLTWTATDAPIISTTILNRTFQSCTVFNGAIGNWDVSSVQSFTFTFLDAISFNQDISTWDMGSATSLNSTFVNAQAFNQDIGSWDVSGVTTLSGLFQNALAFNQDISAWDVSSVTNMGSMFRNTPFDQDLGVWDVVALTVAADMFRDSTLSVANTDSLLNGWDANTHNNTVTLSLGNSKFSTAGRVSHDNLVGDSWTITSAGQTSFDISVKTDNAGDSASDEFQLPLVSAGTINFTITGAALVGSPITITAYNDAATLLEFTSAGTHAVSIVPNAGTTINGWNQNNLADKLKFLDITSWGDFDINNQGTFFGCSNFVGTATDVPIVSSTILNNCFRNCSSFNGDLSGIDTSAITNFTFTFDGATVYNQDMSPWDIGSLASAPNFLNGTAFSQTNYDLLLVAWEAQTHNDTVTIHFGAAEYGAGAPTTARAALVSDSWTITDGGAA